MDLLFTVVGERDQPVITAVHGFIEFVDERGNGKVSVVETRHGMNGEKGRAFCPHLGQKGTGSDRMTVGYVVIMFAAVELHLNARDLRQTFIKHDTCGRAADVFE